MHRLQNVQKEPIHINYRQVFDVFDRIYKLYVRPHLNYGDIIYHRNDPAMLQNFSGRLEQIQNSAALAVSGTWRGTNRQSSTRNWVGKVYTFEDCTDD